MKISIVTAVEMQNNFGSNMNMVDAGQEIIITKNGQEAAVSITNSLTGVLKGRYTIDEEKGKIMGAKYDFAN